MNELVWDEYEERDSSNGLFEKMLNDYHFILARHRSDFAFQAGN
ncbi:MAG: hypothetical protein R2568_08595 [Candidatus Scalindua sp.]|nr:hypothetical protein [Candidatus Scalindua sp.]MDV5166790.1 hypothetical protein [Candidatus Scalindua sp.]